jgi:hypothetical protein
MFGCFTLRVLFGGAMWIPEGRAFVRQTRRFEAEGAKEGDDVPLRSSSSIDECTYRSLITCRVDEDGLYAMRDST